MHLLRIGLLSFLYLLVSCAAVRPSTVGLGGTESVRPAASAARGETVRLTNSSTNAEDSTAPQQAQSAPASPTSSSAAPPSSGSNASESTFQFRPATAGDSFTRSLVLDMRMRLQAEVEGETFDMDFAMSGNQQVRYTIVRARDDIISELALEYMDYHYRFQGMGRDDRERDAVSGNRYVVTFRDGQPQVRTSGGKAPSPEELETVRDDAKEFLQGQMALTALIQGVTNSPSTLSPAALRALAGGSDDKFKMSDAKAKFRGFQQTRSGEKTALIDMSFGMAGGEQDAKFDAKLSGTMLVATRPVRVLSMSAEGPVDMQFIAPDGNGGFSGSGTMKMDISYRY